MADKPRKNKATKAIVARRVEEVLRIRLDGAEFWDVLQYVAEKQKAGEAPWTLEEGEKPLAERTIWWYIQQADQLLKETFRKEAGRKRLIRRHVAQRRRLYAGAVSQADFRCALSILDSEAKLCGLFDDEVMRLIDQLQKQIAEMKAQYGNSNHSPATAGDGSGPENASPTGEVAPRGTDPARSGAGDDSRRVDARPLAGESLAEELDTGPSPLFETERQEPGCGSAGAG